MLRSYRSLALLTIVATALLATTGIASAQPANQYQDTMRGFLPVVESWAGTVQETARAASMKPEPDRIAELADLGDRGLYILDDLRGTATVAPRQLQRAHWQLADAVGTIATAAALSATDPIAAAAQVDEALAGAQPALQTIRFYVKYAGAGAPGNPPAFPLTSR